jgi:hypothetical protein
MKSEMEPVALSGTHRVQPIDGATDPRQDLAAPSTMEVGTSRSVPLVKRSRVKELAYFIACMPLSGQWNMSPMATTFISFWNPHISSFGPLSLYALNLRDHDYARLLYLLFISFPINDIPSMKQVCSTKWYIVFSQRFRKSKKEVTTKKCVSSLT